MLLSQNKAPLLLIQSHIDQGLPDLKAETPALHQHFLSLKTKQKIQNKTQIPNSTTQSEVLQEQLYDAAFCYFKAQLDQLIELWQPRLEQAVWYCNFLARILKTHEAV